LLKDEIQIIDAGARYGIHPNVAEIRCGRQIYAFEPEESEFEYLKQKYASDESYHLFRKALSSRKSVMELRVTAHRGCATISDVNDGSIFFSELRKNEGDIVEVQSIQADTIDNLVAEHLISQPDLIKADVEGHEVQLLEGGSEALRTCLSVSIEMIFDNTYYKQTASRIVEILVDEYDFVLLGFDYDGKGMPIHHLGQSARNPNRGKGVVGGINGYFTRKDDYFKGIKDVTERHYNVVKTANLAFCFGYDDFAFHIVDKLIPGGLLFSSNNTEYPGLRNFLKMNVLKALYRLKTENLQLFNAGKSFFKEKFGESYPDRHRYFRYLDALSGNH
jgi:FkbM family methyltransferase